MCCRPFFRMRVSNFDLDFFMDARSQIPEDVFTLDWKVDYVYSFSVSIFQKIIPRN